MLPVGLWFGGGVDMWVLPEPTEKAPPTLQTTNPNYQLEAEDHWAGFRFQGAELKLYNPHSPCRQYIYIHMYTPTCDPLRWYIGKCCMHEVVGNGTV